jgi:hypothetical protein
MRLAHLSQPASLIGQFSQLIDRTNLLRTVEKLKFSAQVFNVLSENIKLFARAS